MEIQYQEKNKWGTLHVPLFQVLALVVAEEVVDVVVVLWSFSAIQHFLSAVFHIVLCNICGMVMMVMMTVMT